MISERTDYSSLKTEEAREAFMQRTLRGAYGDSATTISLLELLGYVRFSRDKLITVGFEQREAEITAAQTVFSGVSSYLRQHGTTTDLERVQAMDGVIRYAHDVADRDFPSHHEDPVVAAFYTELEGHLNRRMPGDRWDAYGGNVGQ